MTPVCAWVREEIAKIKREMTSKNGNSSLNLIKMTIEVNDNYATKIDILTQKKNKLKRGSSGMGSPVL